MKNFPTDIREQRIKISIILRVILTIFAAEDVDIVALLFQLVPLIKHLLCVF